jgi:peptide/nickel transport system substrate-binding protein
MTVPIQRTRLALVVAAAVLFAAWLAAPGRAQDAGSGGGNVLRIGWAQDPQTLNPFVSLDEEAFNVWSLNYDLLVNFDPENLTPAPGVAESWEVSEDRRTVTFTLDPDRVWSDGEPVTSKDVKFSLEVLGGEGDIFSGYTSEITRIATPDERTVVIETREPDARIIGGLFVYIIPEHVWGKESIDEITGSFQPELPLVGSGPYVVTEFTRGRIIRMELNPEWRGAQPAFGELQYIKYGNQDAVERALTLGEIDMILEVESSTFERLNEDPNIVTRSSPSASYTELAFNLCPEKLCPDAEFNPAIQELEVRQAIAYGIDRDRINQIAARGTSFVANSILPSFYKSFYTEPEQTYPYDPELANQILDEAGWEDNGDEPRTRDGEELSFDLYVRSESAYNIQAARLIEEMGREIGVQFNVQVVSVDKLTELTVRKVDGKPAPQFDTFIWGWGGDPYDPSFLLSLLTTDEIGSLSDGFFSNPEYDALYEQQRGEFDVERRRELIAEMLNIAAENVAYLVLTEDPNLQAYRTDAIAEISPACPADETGDLICEQVSYEPVLALEPASGAVAGGTTETGGDAFLALVAAAVSGALAYFLGLRRGRSEAEPLEVEE